MFKKFFITITAIFFASVMFLSCDAAKDAVSKLAGDKQICLDKFLKDYAPDKYNTMEKLNKLTVKGYDKSAGDLVMALVDLQKKILGKSVIVDCKSKKAKEAAAAVPITATPPDGAPAAKKTESQQIDSADQLPQAIRTIVQNSDSGTEVVILLDATGSMGDDQEAVSSEFANIVADVKAKNGKLGIVWYKDAYDCDDTALGSSGLIDVATDETKVTNYFNNVQPGGGCDLPESLYEGIGYAIGDFDGKIGNTSYLESTATAINWTAKSPKMIIAITDASAQDYLVNANGDACSKEESASSTGFSYKYSKEDIMKKAQEKGVTINFINMGY